jgi:hypothetical protein
MWPARNANQMIGICFFDARAGQSTLVLADDIPDTYLTDAMSQYYGKTTGISVKTNVSGVYSFSAICQENIAAKNNPAICLATVPQDNPFRWTMPFADYSKSGAVAPYLVEQICCSVGDPYQDVVLVQK